MCVCTARPYFNRKDKDEARKEGLYEEKDEMAEEEEVRGKKEEDGARKKLESRKSENTGEEGECKARYAREVTVIVEGRG